jgi:hypothetical protein
LDLKRLIAASHGPEATEAWTSLTPSNAQLDAVMGAGDWLLDHFPTVPGACVMMSTLLASHLEKLGLPPGYIVTGSLYVVGSRFIGDTRVFGEPARLDGKARFSACNSSWDGHAWVVLGDRLLARSLDFSDRVFEIQPARSRIACKAILPHVPMVNMSEHPSETTSVQIQSDDSRAFREAEAGRDAEKGDGESSV